MITMACITPEEAYEIQATGTVKVKGETQANSGSSTKKKRKAEDEIIFQEAISKKIANIENVQKILGSLADHSTEQGVELYKQARQCCTTLLMDILVNDLSSK
jgi:hypothetical protein